MLLRRWLWPWLVVVVRPSCHIIHLVAMSLSAMWHLDVMPEQVVVGERGGFLLTWSCRKHRRPFQLVWVGDMVFLHVLPHPPCLVLVLIGQCHVASTLGRVDGMVVVVQCWDGGQ
jgi:hypothetical protein